MADQTPPGSRSGTADTGRFRRTGISVLRRVATMRGAHQVSDRLAGKTALVTGAASGMGEATSRLFVAEGARVCVTDMNTSRGRDVAADLGSNGYFQQLDVRSAEEWQAAVER